MLDGKDTPEDEHGLADHPDGLELTDLRQNKRKKLGIIETISMKTVP